MGVQPIRPSREEILEKAQNFLEWARWSRCKHFEDRFAQRNFSDPEIFAVIESGQVVEGPEWNSEFKQWKITIEGETLDEEVVRVGLAVDLVDEKIYLISVFSKE